MNTFLKETKEKVEKYLREIEFVIYVEWGDGSCTTFDAHGNTIDDFMIDVEDDGEIFYTPVSNPSVTLQVA